ncbi:MAG: DUF5666 domain-containing protein [Acidobacteriia bacterium]|nr:DUF5666 domain-containing protein [Terriglobia bacterium]
MTSLETVFSIALCVALGLQSVPAWALPSADLQVQEAGQSAVTKRIGAIKSIDSGTITLAPDTGSEVSVTVQPNARILRIAQGEKDLKNATPVQLRELQVGDMIRVRGRASDDARSIAALEIIVITSSTLAVVSEQIRQDWQKRGLGGPVSVVDPGAGTLTISISSFGGKKTIVVRTSKSTVVRRYAPDSAKFEDARLSSLQEVHVGDQLRARGNRSADGSELAAEEIVTGTFPNVAGLVKSVDASTGTISVQDVLSKKTVQLRITADSQLHKIPAEMAQGFAMRLKAAMPPGTPGAAANSSPSSSPPPGANGRAVQSSAQSGGMRQGAGGMGSGMRPGGAPDLQRLLDQTPAVALSDLHKGDAVSILATQGTPSGGSTVIKLFSGVEPILEAAPNGSQAMMLTPWTLGGPTGDAGNQ